jgi:hypothetical protein
MPATPAQINTYLINARTAFVDYGKNLADAQRLGRQDLEFYQLKFRVLKHLLRILVDYFDSSDYENINFFTKAEIRDVMQHLNNICGTNHIIEL